MTDRIGVLGAGGVGSAFAAFLARDGHDVMLIGRGSPHVQEVAACGLTMHPPDGEPWTVRVAVAQYAKDLPTESLDHLLILTKAFDTASAVATVVHTLRPTGVVASPQNGLGIDAVLADVVGAHRALVGVTTVGATLQAPGHVSLSGATADGASLTRFGSTVHARGAAAGARLVALLDSASLPAAMSTQIEVRIWEKLALASMSLISAALQRTVGQVWSADAGRAVVRALFDEVVAVASSQGVEIDVDTAWAHASSVYAGAGEHLTSLATDVAQGRRTELSCMAGAVQQLGVGSGVPVPVHTTVLDMLAVLGAR